MDAWTPPEGAGQAVGCVTTTYTFDPAFFEEECLGRFLGLETDPASDGPLYLIEREEKLAQLTCAGVLVDAQHCQGSRSLRWDLMPARLTGGVQHAKISLLVWSDCIRLMVASANMTPDGYRRNLEVFGVLDYHSGGQANLECLRGAVAFLRQVAASAQPGMDTPSPSLGRWDALLTRTESTPEDWGRPGDEAARAGLSVSLVTTEPRGSSLLEQARTSWPSGGPPQRAVVLSPFFDPPEAENRPARELWSLLRQRGKAVAEYLLIAEDVPGENAVFLHAPASILEAQPPKRPLSTVLSRLDLNPPRPLHAKGLWLENDRWALYIVGSSNFTSRGLGLSAEANLEANLAYLVDRNREPDTYREMSACLPASRTLPSNLDMRWQPRTEEEEDPAGGDLPLPAPFGWAIYRRDAQGAHEVVTLSLSGQPPAGWWLAYEDDDQKCFYDEKSWRAAGSPEEVEIAWDGVRPPSGFWVRWSGKDGKAWWPVNVASAASLPPPEELRALPLDVLIDILTSTRPLHRVLGQHHRPGGEGPGPYLDRDPHKRVDTTGFLLQRTRRFSWALAALKRRLEMPLASRQCLEWRLHGPVGVEALAQAVHREAESSPEEEAFLLCELALELAGVQPRTAPGCLPAAEVRAGIMAMVQSLGDRVDLAKLRSNPDLRDYVTQVFLGGAK